MINKTQSSKLIELRAKTDRQLVQFISHRLDAGLSFTRWAADSHGRGRTASKEIFENSASKAYIEVRDLLPWTDGLTRADRLGLEFKLEQLRRALADLSARTRLVQTA